MDPKAISLAFSMSSNPGVFAVLLGSGVSRAAGIMTGWEIVLDLCGKLAAAHGEIAGQQPDKWYKEKYDKEPRYDDLLEQLAITPDARQALLERYFEPSDTELEQGLKQPTQTHHAIAHLVKLGFIKMIITTNFDRLMEMALIQAGVSYEVAYNADMLSGMRPFVHSNCTLLKLHGDYKDTRTKNIGVELATYDDTIDKLLDRVFDEFGLIIAGWSGTWDTALRNAMLRTVTRRYAWYWLKRGFLTDEAQELIKHRDAVIIDISDADSFFRQIQSQVESITSYEQVHPDTVQLAIATVKRLISKGLIIDLQDFIQQETLLTRQYALEASVQSSTPFDTFQQELNRYFSHTETTAATLSVLAAFPSVVNRNIIRTSVQRLLIPKGDGIIQLIDLKLFPLLICVYSAGISAVAIGDYETVKTVTIEPKMYDIYGTRYDLVEQINVTYVFEHSTDWLPIVGINELTRVSNYLYEKIKAILSHQLPTEHEYERAFTLFEFLTGLLIISQGTEFEWAPPGKYYWTQNGRRMIYDFLEEGSTMGESWPLLSQLFTSQQHFEKSLAQLEKHLNERRNILAGQWKLVNTYKKSQI